MKLNIERSVTVITPTVGSTKLLDAILSIQSQTYSNILHLIVCDGAEYYDPVNEAIRDAMLQIEHAEKSMQLMIVPFNTGANGFNGQRIYASIPHLVNSDYVFFLDEDNWYAEDHVKSLVATIEKDNLDWAYSFRNIFTIDKQFVAEDNCESLGRWPIYFSHDNPQYLVDTSAFAFKREFIQATCHRWHSGPWGEDRRYFYSIHGQSHWNTSGKHTLCYRLDGNPNSVNIEFFIEGNKKQLEYYKGTYPWQK